MLQPGGYWRCQREGESERCLCLCLCLRQCVYHMLHCLLVILASRKQSCSAAGTSKSSSRKETNVACQRGSSRLALGRLANVGGALRSQAQTRVSSLAPSLLRSAAHCRLSLTLSFDTLSCRRPYATHASAAPKGRQHSVGPSLRMTSQMSVTIGDALYRLPNQ